MKVRADTRRGLWGFLDRYPFTLGVSLTCAALFVYAGYRSGGWPVDPDLRIALGANVSALALSEPWRLLTAPFLHYEILHLGLNVATILYWGRLLEIHFGSARLWVLYIVSGLVGSLCSALWQEGAIRFGVQQAGLASYGASGAVFGLLFLGLVLAQRAPARLGSLRPELSAWIGLSFLFAILNATPVDHAAHLGGSLAGAGLGWIFCPEPGEDLAPAWSAWGVVFALAVFAAFGRILWGLREFIP